MNRHKWIGGTPKAGYWATCEICQHRMYHQPENHVKVYTRPNSDIRTPIRPNCLPPSARKT